MTMIHHVLIDFDSLNHWGLRSGSMLFTVLLSPQHSAHVCVHALTLLSLLSQSTWRAPCPAAFLWIVRIPTPPSPTRRGAWPAGTTRAATRRWSPRPTANTWPTASPPPSSPPLQARRHHRPPAHRLGMFTTWVGLRENVGYSCSPFYLMKQA